MFTEQGKRIEMTQLRDRCAANMAGRSSKAENEILSYMSCVPSKESRDSDAS